MEEGFVDLVFALHNHQRAADGSQHYIATGTHHRKPLGFAFTLPKEWKQGTLGDSGLVTFQAGITVESTGESSDHFVTTLRDLYQIAGPELKMSKSIAFTVISLGGDPRTPEQGPVKMKLFYEPAEDDPKHDDHYAEHYLNIDLATKLIQFHEKDPEYRPAVIHALTTTNG
jgi:hypothetical protein